MTDWVLATEQSGYTRHFDVAALPVSIGASDTDDLVLANVTGSIQLGLLDGVFFAQPVRGSENVRLNGELLRGSRRLADGDTIALDTARLICKLADGRLCLAIEARITAGDTAPPDFAATAEDKAGEVQIKPISFDPKASRRRDSGRRLRFGALAIYGAFVVLAVAGWFAFTAKSVRFEFTPPPDLLELPETTFRFRLSDRYLLRSGEHRITAELAEYYPIDQVVEVDSRSDQVIPLDFVRLPGLISFATEPEAAAEVRIDGELIGTTPLEDFEVRPGTHQIQFTAERFLTEVVTLDVDGGHKRDALSVELTPSWAPVSVNSSPAGAEVLVDGRVLGQTPAELELTAGDRNIELRLAGYNSWRREIRVVADEPLVLPDVTLTLANGQYSLLSEPADAIVYLNGEYHDRTPVNLTVRPNVEHELMIQKPGYVSQSLTFTLAPGGRESTTIELTEQLGEVEIRSTPPGAQILVNNEVRGVTPLPLELMTIEQTIVVALNGFAPDGQTVTPRAGYPQQLEFELVPLNLATGSGYDPVITTGFDTRLRVVPAGTTFQMGSSRSDPDRTSREALRTVEVTSAFYLAETEMTNAQYRLCDPNHDSGAFGGLSLNEDDQPVVNVTMRDIKLCLNRLSIMDGLQPFYDESDALQPRISRNGYRLPTEAEWALAARVAGRENEEPLRFSWGQELPLPGDRVDNIADLSARDVLEPTLVTYTDGFAASAPVGSFLPNAVGLFDMGGNVSEWVQDYYDPLAEYGEEVMVDPRGPEEGRQNVVRGPNWQSATTRLLRLSYVDFEDSPRDYIGFRIARNIE